MSEHFPKWPLRLLRKICKPAVVEEIEGDLIELYEKRGMTSRTWARIRLLWDTLRSIRWINLKKPNPRFSGIMLGNYLKVSYRNLRKDYVFSLINLSGLCLGLAVFIVMTMMVLHELSFDKFHTKSDRIFEVIQVFQQADGADPEIWTSALLAEAVESELSYVEKAVSLFGAASNWVEVNDQRFFEEDGIIADTDFFEVFDFELALGDPLLAFDSKRSTVISKQLAAKYFGNENPLGQVIDHEFYGPFTVTGVLKDIPSNSFIQFDYVLTPDFDEYFTNVAAWFPSWFQSWQGDPAATYVLLGNPKDRLRFDEDVAAILRKNLGSEQVNRHFLVNLEDLHFGSNHIDGRINHYVKGDRSQVELFALVAVLILLMACANYVNITTARSEKRHKEVGIRKAIGAVRSQLTTQFLTESFVLVSGSIVVAMAIAYVALPYFQLITGISLEWDIGQLLAIAPYLLAILVLVTVIAGLYPALILSRFQAIAALRRKNSKTQRTMGLRGILLMAQFGLVMLMSSGLIIIHQQYRFLSDTSLGYDTDHLAVIEINSGPVRQNYPTIKNELLQIQGVRGVTGLTRMFSGYRSGSSVDVNEPTHPEKWQAMKFYGMDEDGLETLSLTLLQGEGFQGQFSLDSSSVLLNQTAAASLDVDVLGQWIDITNDEGDPFRAKVIGIIEDFHFESLHEPIKPAVIGYYINPIVGLDDIVVKVGASQIGATMEQIEAIHNRYDTNDVMTWEFLDDMTQRAYEDELKFQRIFTGAAIISLLIALLGLVGLIAYSSAARTKEFGIRKVLGARSFDIFLLQSQTFLRFAGLAAILAIPLGWWIARQWLSHYAYGIQLTPTPFLLVIAIVMMATVLTALAMGQGTARKNPVESLRYE